VKLSEVRKGFRERGQTIRDWARQHAFEPALVYALLAGRVAGTRGRSHEIAVALGLKPDPPVTVGTKCPLTAVGMSKLTSTGEMKENPGDQNTHSKKMVSPLEVDTSPEPS
jgi:gp16 family phage-associated protein